MDEHDIIEAIAGTPAERMLAGAADNGVLRNDPGGLGLTQDELDEGYGLIMSLNVIPDDESLGGGWQDVMLSDQSHRLARKVSDSRRDGHLRLEEARHAVLRQLQGNGWASAKDVIRGAQPYGAPLSAEQFALAARSLEADGLVECFGSSRTAIHRLRITNEGSVAVGSGQPLGRHMRRPRARRLSPVSQTTYNTMHNSVRAGGDFMGQAQLGGSNNSMQVTQQIASGSVEQIIQMIDRYLEEHGEDDGEEAARFNGELTEARAELQDGNVTEDSWLRRTGSLLRTGAAVGADAVTLVTGIARLF